VVVSDRSFQIAYAGMKATDPRSTKKDRLGREEDEEEEEEEEEEKKEERKGEGYPRNDGKPERDSSAKKLGSPFAGKMPLERRYICPSSKVPR